MSLGQGLVAVVGGGFYGCAIAESLALRGARLVLLEQEGQLLARSSAVNQARLHAGYHYPRSFGTAYRSRLNFSRFVAQYRAAIVSDFVKLYAIAGPGSKVNPRQFATFCRNIDAPLQPASPVHRRLFNPRLIAAVYEAEEYAFDVAVLRRLMEAQIARTGVDIRLGSRVIEIVKGTGSLTVLLADGRAVQAGRVFNCTYSGLNKIRGIGITRQKLKHEITEIALILPPEELQGISVTVMDGPFFSFMPFPSRGLVSLSHVRYTPHTAWVEGQDGTVDPYAALAAHPKITRYPCMVRDASRYLPSLERAEYRGSLFEVKTVLVKHEADDGRPILFEWQPDDRRVVSVLGAKIDNVYDILAAIEGYEE